MVKYIIILTYIFYFISSGCFSQNVNCDSLSAWINDYINSGPPTVQVFVLESSPEPVIGYKKLNEKLDLRKGSKDIGSAKISCTEIVVVILENGYTDCYKITRADNPNLNDSIITILKTIRFKPARQLNKPIKCLFPFVFRY